jgi:hypothetical protein
MNKDFNPYAYNHHPWAGQTVRWFPSDDFFTYKKNLENKKDLLEKFNWIGKNIEYSFNSQGFRSNEFSQIESLMALGCSYTMGVGLPLDCTWPDIVSKNLSLKCHNLGIGSCSNDTTFKLARHYIPLLRPKIVVLLSPEIEHMELIQREKKMIKRFFPRLIRENPNDTDMLFYKNWLSDPINGELNREKNQLAIQQICENFKIKFLCLDHTDLSRDLDLARDLQHPGMEAQATLSEKILEKI